MANPESRKASVRRQMFMSVFPSSATTASAPTPSTTPISAVTAPGESFGGPSPFPAQQSLLKDSNDPIQRELIKHRAWHLATTYLTIPKERIESTTSAEARSRWIKAPEGDTLVALDILIALARRTPRVYEDQGDEESDIILWYMFEIDSHFHHFVIPDLLSHCKKKDPSVAIYCILKTLRLAESRYMYPVINHILPAVLSSHHSVATNNRTATILQEVKEVRAFFQKCLRDITRLRFPSRHWYNSLQTFFTIQSTIALNLRDKDDETAPGFNLGKETETRTSATVEGARRNIIKVLHGMQRFGLGGSKLQQALAEALDEMMTKYIQATCVKEWESPSEFTKIISDWVEEDLARCIIEAFHSLSVGEQDTSEPPSSKERTQFDLSSTVSLETVNSWKEMTYSRLGFLRVRELFDIIVDLESSKGAIEDLKRFIASPESRALLTISLTRNIRQRLLHPGASTVDILQFYISMIRAFSLLDPTGVLLDKVARPVRRYLKEREDTIHIVVAGLLADPDDAPGNDNPNSTNDVLIELATELSRSAEYIGQGGDDDGDMDWDDMNWEPDPIDAGPEYNKSLSSDVVGSLISLFDSTDVFVKEIQNIVGERLLKKNFNLLKETEILEHLKLRFSENDLQACMVMLRDITDSGRVDHTIRSDQKINHLYSERRESGEGQQPPEFHPKFLSHLFWPTLRDETFVVPPEIVTMQRRYESGFEALKQSRKLTWLNALGQVKVFLDLDDRVVQEDVTTWQAAVIYAFQDSSQTIGKPVTRAVGDLVTKLQMDESMVRNALTLWVGKRVLREDQKDVYTVLERVDDTTLGKESAEAAVAAAAESEAVASAPAIKSTDVTTVEKMHMFWQFIQGMLTNRGAMPLQGIITMLQFAVPGGFPYSSEELREFLGHMIDEDKLEIAAGKYKIKA